MNALEKILARASGKESVSVGEIVDEGPRGFTNLDSPYGITTVTIGTSTYALVTSQFDHAVQIIDITTIWSLLRCLT